MKEIIFGKGSSMKHKMLLVPLLGMSFGVVCHGWAVEPNPKEAKAVAEIRKLGGDVEYDKKDPDQPVINVRMQCNVSDSSSKFG
jgi:hypothetical protein